MSRHAKRPNPVAALAKMLAGKRPARHLAPPTGTGLATARPRRPRYRRKS